MGTSLDVSAGSGSVLDVQAGLTTSVGGSHGPDVGFSARAAFGGSIVFSVGAGAVASLGSSQGLEPNSLGTSSAGIDPAISHPKGTIASGLQIAAPVVPGRTARTSSLLDGPLSGPPTTDSGTGNSEISSPLWLGGAGAQQPPVVQLPADSPTRPVIPGGQVQATSSAADANANTPTQEQAPNAVSAPPLVPLTPTILVTFLPPVTELGQQAQATVAEDEQELLLSGPVLVAGPVQAGLGTALGAGGSAGTSTMMPAAGALALAGMGGDEETPVLEAPAELEDTAELIGNFHPVAAGSLSGALEAIRVRLLHLGETDDEGLGRFPLATWLAGMAVAIIVADQVRRRRVARGPDELEEDLLLAGGVG